MSGEPIRLLHDTSMREEIRQRLVREAAVKPQYDFDRGLARLRAAIANMPSGSDPAPVSEPPSARLSVTKYAVKGSVWRVAGVVGLAATSAVIGLRAWGPTSHVARAEGQGRGPASPAANAPEGVDLAVLARAEAGNLAQIKAVLGTDPHGALTLAEDGNRLYAAGGSLHAEREASAITALVALGRRAEAQSRARRFLENYPNSPLSEGVRQSAKL